jgi:YHS domain-containing protein
MKSLFSILSFSVLLTTLSFSQDNVVTKRTSHFNLQKGIAVKGYDPIVFFKANKATQANGAIACEYNGVKYFFTSTKNLNQFKSTPTRFEPQYGGWCALHMSVDGTQVRANPRHFTVHKGKLYFFASAENKSQWEKNSMEREGNVNWENIMD